MKLFSRLLALFLILPAVELALLIQVGERIGFWPTVGMIILTAFLGSYLAKREGLGVWRQFNEKIARGAIPSRELLDGIIILCAGALLITPGVLTDLTGFLALLPPTRAVLRRFVTRRIERAMKTGSVRFGIFDLGGRGYGTATEPPEKQWSGTPHEVPRYADRSAKTPPNGDGDTPRLR